MCSGAEPSGFSGSGDMVRSLVSTSESGCGAAAAAWAAALEDLMAVKDNAASAVAESCMVSRRDMFMAGLLADIPELGVYQSSGFVTAQLASPPFPNGSVHPSELSWRRVRACRGDDGE